MKTFFLIDDREDDRDIFQLPLLQPGHSINCVTPDIIGPNKVSALTTLPEEILIPY